MNSSKVPTRGFEGAVNLLRTCANVKRGDQVLVVTDSATDPEVAGTIMAAAVALHVEATKMVMSPRALPGDEPPAPVVAAMLRANVVICPTSRTLYHTNARIAACRKGARFISMAGATMPVLASKAMVADFRRQARLLNKLANRLTRAQHIRVTNPAGTNLEFNVEGRTGYEVSGMATHPGEATGTPDIEAYIAPLEKESNGVLFVDGSTSVTGVVRQPIKITIRNGMARSFGDGSDALRLSRILREAGSRAAYRVCEFGIGLNPLARIRGSIIEDEGKLGTAHVALGDNTRIGGTNKAPTHVDLVFRNPHVQLDGISVLKGKRFMI